MTWENHQGMLRVVLRRSLCCGLVALAAASLDACSSGTETGNPSFQAELSYTAFSSQPLQVGLPASNAAAVVTDAWLDLDAVGLVAAGTCGATESVAVSVPALGIGDHAVGKHNVTSFELAQGSYCGLDLPFVSAAAGAVDGAPAELAGHSILIEGTLSDGTPFLVLSNATPTVHLLADAGSFAVTSTQPRTLIAFDLAAWLSNLDFSAAAVADGAIRISAAQNAPLLAQFELNLASGIALYRDEDGDGKLDSAAVRLAHAN